MYLYNRRIVICQFSSGLFSSILTFLVSYFVLCCGVLVKIPLLSRKSSAETENEILENIIYSLEENNQRKSKVGYKKYGHVLELLDRFQTIGNGKLNLDSPS